MKSLLRKQTCCGSNKFVLYCVQFYSIRNKIYLIIFQKYSNRKQKYYNRIQIYIFRFQIYAFRNQNYSNCIQFQSFRIQIQNFRTHKQNYQKRILKIRASVNSRLAKWRVQVFLARYFFNQKFVYICEGLVLKNRHFAKRQNVSSQVKIEWRKNLIKNQIEYKFLNN